MDIIPQLVANSIISGSIYALIALGFNFLFSTAKFFDLSYGALTAIGGYGAFFIIRKLDLPIGIGVVVGVFVGALIAFALNKGVYEKLHRRKASNLVKLVAALGAMTALQAIIAILFTSQFQTLPIRSGAQHVFEIGGAFITEIQLIIFICAILIGVFLLVLSRCTKFGKAVRAIGDDEEVSKIVGINTEKVTGKVFLIAGGIAGLVGVLIGFDSGIEPTMGLSLLLKGVVASIVGGIGNIYGGVFGGFLLGFIENFGIWKISGEWKDAIAFGVLIIFLVFRPQGIFKKR